MEFLPIFIRLQQTECLLIGGGEVAARKTRLLLKAGAQVRIVSPTLGHDLQDELTAGRITYQQGTFKPDDLDQCQLVIAATDDMQVNLQVFHHAKERQIPVNVVDQPELCTFIVPSILDRSPLIIAVSTGGASPVLARLVRARLESLIPAAYGRLAQLADCFREQVKTRLQPAARRPFWEKILQGSIAERVFTGQQEIAVKMVEQALTDAEQDDASKPPMGEVYLIGGGPGDPDLLTFRAARLMQQADVVVYDRLVAKAVLELTRRDAQRIYVGKERNQHAMRQEEINQLLARLAKEGKRVVRLKGGDPFIFGRGGEEIDTLAAEGVPFQVVPGITAASGCAAYSGIPLTHRDYAQSVTFVTGHLKDGTINLNWNMLAQPNQTIVFYMGLLGLPIICQELTAHGVSPEMPIALIQQGTTEKQHIFSGTLANIHQVIANEKPQPPTLIIVGEVVRLQNKFAWYQAPKNAVQGATTPIEPGS